MGYPVAIYLYINYVHVDEIFHGWSPDLLHPLFSASQFGHETLSWPSAV